MVMSWSGFTSSGSMLIKASLSTSPTGVSEHGADDFAVAAPGGHLEHGLKEGMLCPLMSSRSIAILGVASWLLPKDASTRNFVMSKGEEDVDPATL